jgi:diketogulonate reductase-like aldo/keto reductase
MGTWITFNVGRDPVAREARTEVLRTFFEMGGGLIDSSPMYGSAEAVVGAGLRRLGPMPGLFAATKVWTSSGADGPLQIAESQGLWGLDRFDLLQVHNLLAWRAHLDTLFALKAEGKVRYVGITTSHGRRHAELESVMRDKPVDFVQATYNARDREVEQRILPLAAERGIAFIANRPFQGGSLIERVQKHPLPPWAADLDCANWAQFLLKYIVSHPAVTCAIPATRQIAHMRENMGATLGVLPEPATRALMAKYVADL